MAEGLGSILGGAAGGAVVAIMIKGIDAYSKPLSDAKSKIKDLSTTSAMLQKGFLAAGVASSAFAILAIKAAADGKKAYTQLAFAVKDAFQTKVLSNYADELSKLTGINNDHIMSSMKLMSVMGLSAQQIKNNISGVLDLSEAYGIDLENATKAVTNAIKGDFGLINKITRDNVVSMTDLSRVFDKIKGTAADTASPLEKLKNQFNIMIGAVGTSLLPVVEDLATFFTKIAGWVTDHEKLAGAIVKVGLALGAVAVATRAVAAAQALLGVSGAVGGLGNVGKIGGALGTVGGVAGGAIAGLGLAAYGGVELAKAHPASQEMIRQNMQFMSAGQSMFGSQGISPINQSARSPMSFKSSSLLSNMMSPANIPKNLAKTENDLGTERQNVTDIAMRLASVEYDIAQKREKGIAISAEESALQYKLNSAIEEYIKSAPEMAAKIDSIKNAQLKALEETQKKASEVASILSKSSKGGGSSASQNTMAEALSRGAGTYKVGISGKATWVPKTAEGGIVNSPQIRMVGEAGPEAIIPLNKSGGMGVNVNIGNVYGLDARDVAQSIQRSLRSIVSY